MNWMKRGLKWVSSELGTNKVRVKFAGSSAFSWFIGTVPKLIHGIYDAIMMPFRAARKTRQMMSSVLPQRPPVKGPPWWKTGSIGWGLNLAVKTPKTILGVANWALGGDWRLAYIHENKDMRTLIEHYGGDKFNWADISNIAKFDQGILESHGFPLEGRPGESIENLVRRRKASMNEWTLNETLRKRMFQGLAGVMAYQTIRSFATTVKDDKHRQRLIPPNYMGGSADLGGTGDMALSMYYNNR